MLNNILPNGTHVGFNFKNDEGVLIETNIKGTINSCCVGDKYEIVLDELVELNHFNTSEAFQAIMAHSHEKKDGKDYVNIPTNATLDVDKLEIFILKGGSKKRRRTRKSKRSKRSKRNKRSRRSRRSKRSKRSRR